MKTCPLCGCKSIAKVKRKLIRRANRIRYEVPDLEFYECSHCGEKFFDRAASRKIDEFSPALSRRSRRRSA